MIYLDSAATTLQKPPQVAQAVVRAMSTAASPGRGGHPWGREAARIAFSCREAAAELFRVPTPEQVVFTGNATHGLNIAIHSLVKPGDTVVISGYEHNAVTRPLHGIPGVRVRVAGSRPFDTAGTAKAFREELERDVDVVICTHVSNVFGFILPVEKIAAMCREKNIPLIVDASQSAGCVPINFTELGAQFIAMPGHKGLYGPQGTGLLLCAREGEPLLRGGTGSLSRLQDMPEFLPDRLEAGTHNIPGIAGLEAGIRFVARQGVERIGKYEGELIRTFVGHLSQLPGIELFMSRDPSSQSGVLSFRVEGMDCQEIGEQLGEAGIAVRAGLHCAPVAHASAGTLERGTVRISVSRFNHRQELCRAAQVLEHLLQRR